MKRPFFSIITPTLNSSRYLQECIDSVDSQNFKDYEHIFIDSFSTDDTLRILNNYKKKNPSKVFIYKYPKKGIADAFNKGILHSRGRFLNFLGSDDRLGKNALEQTHRLLKDDKYDWSFGNFNIIDGKGNVIKRKRYLVERISYLGLLIHFYICHQTVFMKKSVFEKYGLFRTDLKYNMDHEFWLRIYKKNQPLYIPLNLADFRLTGNNPSSDKWNQFLEKNKLNKEILGICPYLLIFIIKYIDFLFFRAIYLLKGILNFNR